MSGPLVSVVIIFCNEERFLPEALQSVERQTMDDWELILVDDGSTDTSTDIARRLADADPTRVRYLDHAGHQNRGMSASRNLGVRVAQGRYVSYLDGDDCWLPQKLERQVELLAEHPDAAIVYGPLTRWYSWTGRRIDQASDDQYGLDGDGVSLAPGTLLQPPDWVATFIRHKDLVPSGALFERELFLSIGGAEDEFTDNYEDAVAFVKMGLRAAAYVADESWYLYRQYPLEADRARRRASRPDPDRPRGDRARLRFIDWVEGYLTREQVGSPALWRAARDARRQIEQPARHEVHRQARRVRSALRRLGPGQR